MKLSTLFPMFIALFVSLSWPHSGYAGSGTDPVVTHLLSGARKRLAAELEAREAPLLRPVGYLGTNLSLLRVKRIARKRVEFTIGRWIAILRLGQAKAVVRSLGQADTEERTRMLRSVTEYLRRGLRYSSFGIWKRELQKLVATPPLANQPWLDFVRCYLITALVIEHDRTIIKSLDEMFIFDLKIALEIQRYERWRAATVRECEFLRTAISIVDMILVLSNPERPS